MSSNMAGLLEMSLVFGVVLALAIWELISLKREKRKSKKSETTEPRG
jgi:hypothetical protein